jgi:hypothetical protein
MQPTTRQKMAKPTPTTKPTRKPKNNTKHQKGDENDLKLTESFSSVMEFRELTDKG